ncbi:MAG: dTDP-4-dehydrorhamnose 3,5-epimerase [Saprospiraceae bacterium]|nr:dTDP-4-dehydrorhamnose 3,5-epimerase [Saprospiraceae bacterium]
MGWHKTNFDGVWIFEPKIHADERGYFFESFNASGLPDEYKNIQFVQDNEAKSAFGVLRGLHYQLPPYSQLKLVRVVTGEVLDVIVDIRPGSKTYGKHLSVILNDIQKKQLLVPHGFAHGYVVLSEEAIFAYKCDNYYHPSSDAGIYYNDPVLSIHWILDDHLIRVSEKDRLQPAFGNHKIYQ